MKLSFFITGLGFILVGLKFIIKPYYYNPIDTFQYDFRNIKWPLGISFITVGLLSVIISFKKSPAGKEYEICPKCENVYKVKKDQKGICPKCHVALEEVEGFYDRHPELREKEDTDSTTQ